MWVWLEMTSPIVRATSRIMFFSWSSSSRVALLLRMWICAVCWLSPLSVVGLEGFHGSHETLLLKLGCLQMYLVSLHKMYLQATLQYTEATLHEVTCLSRCSSSIFHTHEQQKAGDRMTRLVTCVHLSTCNFRPLYVYLPVFTMVTVLAMLFWYYWCFCSQQVFHWWTLVAVVLVTLYPSNITGKWYNM